MATDSFTSTAAAVVTGTASPISGGIGSTYTTANFSVSVNARGVTALTVGGSAITYPLALSVARELALSILRLSG